MAKADILKFRELLLTDAEFQEKLRKAAEAYKGEADDKAVFDNVLIPLAKEYGLSATYEEFREYAEAFSKEADGELSEDELTQVAGGKGDGVVACIGVGAGIGRTTLINSKAGCFFLAMGVGICVYEGVTLD